MRTLFFLGAVSWLACGKPPSSFDAGLFVDGGPNFAAFSLLDVNANSKRSGQQVSPRDYAGQVTGWYFGHST
jgi:hypothetical protein